MTKYEIWIGYYHLGQGYTDSTKPKMIATIEAPNFKVACTLHELRSSLNSIETSIKNNEYVDEQTCRWFYDFDTNTNSWIGQYFESEKEALESFK